MIEKYRSVHFVNYRFYLFKQKNIGIELHKNKKMLTPFYVFRWDQREPTKVKNEIPSTETATTVSSLSMNIEPTLSNSTS